MVDKIFLIGFMGCGKSTYGKKLAKALNWDFLDMDHYIEDQEGNSIKTIFEEKGETYFRQLEHQFLETVDQLPPSVIATGGGAPCFYDNMDLMKQSGKSIYIKLSPNSLALRLKGEQAQRPLVAEKTKEELLEFIIEKLGQRSVYYDRADLVFDYETICEEDFLTKIKAVIN